MSQTPGMTTTTTTHLGPVGFATGPGPDDAAALEAAGARTLWLAGGSIDRLDRLTGLLTGTRDAVVVPGIVPAGVHPAADVAALHAEASRQYPGRYLTGLGAPQQPRALDLLGAYLDELDGADPPVPRAERILAALGPRKLALARERFAGAVTLLVTPEHTASARAALGPDRLLAVMLPAVLGDDLSPVRELMGFLLQVPGYRANTRRLGFTDAEIAVLTGAGPAGAAHDDRLAEAVAAHGTPDDIAARVAEHHAAGADHVVISPLGDGSGGTDTVRALAGVLPD